MNRNVIEAVKEKAVELATEHTSDELIVITVDDQRESAMLTFYEQMVGEYNVPPESVIRVLAQTLAGRKTSYGYDHQPVGSLPKR